MMTHKSYVHETDLFVMVMEGNANIAENQRSALVDSQRNSTAFTFTVNTWAAMRGEPSIPGAPGPHIVGVRNRAPPARLLEPNV